MICLTGAELTTQALARRLLDDAAPTLQEVRLDLLEGADHALFELLRAAKVGGKALLVTCRGSSEGGGFTGAEHQRAELLRAALREVGPAYLDLELSAPGELRRELFGLRGATKLILSWHCFEGRATAALPEGLEQAPADLLKIALQIDDAADLSALRSRAAALAQRRDLQLVTVGMGAAGLLSRALYGRFGSPWTYAAAQGESVTAPGQLSLARCRAWRVEQQHALTPLALLGGEQVLRSPGLRVYNEVFARRGLPLIYLPVVTRRPAQTLELLAELGFGGCSVTMPAKRELAAAAGITLDATATRLGAVNTIRLGPEGTRAGSNTDAPAVRQILDEAGAAGRDALVLGAGGAAAAAVDALQALGCPVTLCGRDPGRTAALARRLGCATTGWEVRGDLAQYAVLVNATPCGADGASDPLPPSLADEVWSDTVVLDAVQRSNGALTPLLCRARSGGARVIDGRAWWTRQGALQMETLAGCRLAADELRVSPRKLRVPGSKSQTQRALVLAALACGESHLEGPLDCDDTRHLRRALGALGAQIDDSDPGRWTVGGIAGAPGSDAPGGDPLALWCGEAGTTLRFVAPLSLLAARALLLDGSTRLRERPLDALTGALEVLGVAARRQGDAALPLLLARAVPTAAGARVRVDASRSSQFASGLLMAAPRLPGGLTVELTGEIVSAPYLRMTLEAMAAFGVDLTGAGGRALVVPEGSYRAATFEVEGDWSSGAFMLAGGLIAGRELEVANLRRDSVQGDRAFADHLEALRRGGEGELVFDLTDCPDLIAPLAAACAAGRGDLRAAPARICGAAHARLKESDRVAVLASGLRQVGVEVQERPDGLTITPCPRLRPAALDPHNDHRMAMAFGLLSLREPGIGVTEPGCVSKSYPSFWRDLELLRCR
jgi:3-phosphoshikimate 1-carboxyvinyltransferase